MNQADYIDGNFRIFGLYGADSEGNCLCGNPHCKAIFKHPRSSNWQHTPHWSDEQLDIMEEMGQFDTGFGVLCDGNIIIDIDPRNGGKLEDWQEYYDQSGFVVETGGGGWHIYFSKPECAALASHLPEFKGIDFKSSGYVVGCGSIHASGSTYEAAKGHPCDITEAPEKLLQLLEKKGTHRASVDGQAVDVTDSEIGQMLECISPDCDYEQWYRCGMAVHQSTGGQGFDLWDNWSQAGASYKAEEMEPKWHSFGKSANPVGLGTLLHYAKEGGYKESVTFDYVPEDEAEPEQSLIKEMLNYPFDPCRPPSLAGTISNWINDNCINLRENLAVGAALHTIGSMAGCNYTDVSYGGTPNLYIACVADSGSGKEGIIKAVKKMFGACDLSRCVHTSIKSEQEIVRNLIDENKSFYRMDEFGEHLAKFDSENAPAYLRGIKPQLLSSYSIAGGAYELGGDLYRETEKELKNSINGLQKIIDNNEDKNGKVQAKLDRKLEVLEALPDGIQNFFISIIGFAAPNKFYEGITYDSVTNGFVGRCMFFIERNGNPKPRRHFVPKHEIDMGFHMQLMSVINGSGDILTEDKAEEAMQEMITYFVDKAESEAADSVTPIWRRGIELTIKVSLILAIPTKVRTFEHVCWAFNLIKSETESRANIAISNIASEDKERRGEGLMRMILSKITTEHGESTGVLKSKCGTKYTKADVESAIAILEKNGRIIARKSDNKKGAKTTRWFLV